MKCQRCNSPISGHPSRKFCAVDPCLSERKREQHAAAWARRKADPKARERDLAQWRARDTPERNRAQYERTKETGAYERAKARRRGGRPPMARLASECMVKDCDRKPIAKDRCSRHYRRMAAKAGETWATETDYKARCRRFGTHYERFNVRDIYERDGWVCQLCLQPVDPALEFPDRQSASLDHVRPLSLGGDHVPGNAQLAHLFCNMSKGDGTYAHRVEAVMDALAQGLDYPAIAELIGRSVKTVRRAERRAAELGISATVE